MIAASRAALLSADSHEQLRNATEIVVTQVRQAGRQLGDYEARGERIGQLEDQLHSHDIEPGLVIGKLGTTPSEPAPLRAVSENEPDETVEAPPLVPITPVRGAPLA